MWDRVSPRLTVCRVTLGFGVGLEDGGVEAVVLLALLVAGETLATGGGADGRRHFDGSSAQSSR